MEATLGRNIPMICATLRNTLIKFTLNPVCVNSVLKAIPSDSPQCTMQKELNTMMKKVGASRCRPTANTARIEKRMQPMISNGISSMV